MRRPSIAAALVAVLLATPAAASAEEPPKLHDLAQAVFSASSAASTTKGGPVVRRVTRAVDGIVITRDSTLAEVGAEVPRLVHEVAPGVWEVHRDIHVINNARLLVAWPQVKEVRLISTSRRFASIIARNGHLQFRGRRAGSQRRLLIHSWNPLTRAVDRNLDDGRPVVLARRRSRLTIADTRFEHLGFYEGAVSGVALVSKEGKESTGDVRRSRFSNNYFGAYTFESQDMTWIDNEFADNVIYGFDPHDDSSGFVVRDNYAARNGRHGIIFSRNCRDNRIIDNVSEDNGWHGIVLDDGKAADGPSNDNLIAGNVVRGNKRVGISIDGSHSNVVAANKVSGSRYGVRVIRDSSHNRIMGNTLTASSDYGVFLDGQPRNGRIVKDTVISENVISGAETGARLRNTARTEATDNVVRGVVSHGFKVDGFEDRDITIAGNRITGRGPNPVFIEGRVLDEVSADRNVSEWNYPFAHDLARALGWFVGPMLWALLLAAVVLGPLIVRRRAPRRATQSSS
jgi:parallel beta-helix repeat protein